MTDDELRRAVEASSAPKRWHLTRFAMYSALEGLLAAEDGPDREVLTVSHSELLAGVLGLEQARRRDAAYPEHDIAALEFADATFDVVVADQVLEHVAGGPFAAFAECRRVLRPGGVLVQTTCLMNEVHDAPMDFWRFTTHALGLLAEGAGLEVMTVGGWGNREASRLIERGLRHLQVPEDPSHPFRAIAIEDDPRHPIVTWVVARVPAEARA